MRWVLLGLTVVVAILFGLGYLADQSANIDTRQSSVIPYAIGGVLFVVDLALLIGFVLYRAFDS